MHSSLNPTFDVSLLLGDSREVLGVFCSENSIDAVVTDPPYELDFMGHGWDRTGVANDVTLWREVLRVMKPGAHLLAFSGTRTYHRMVCAIEDAGFEVRDQLAWVYGSGMPKSLDVSKQIDKLDAVREQRDRRRRFTEWMRSTGLTISQINQVTASTMGGHYLTAAAQPAVCNREHFELLRPLIRDVPAWIEQMVDERTVESQNFKARPVVGTRVGTNTQVARLGCPGQDSARHEFALTVSHTDDAKAWEGWGTALKPAWEPIVLARKPFKGTVAANVLQHGTGAMNINAGRIASSNAGRWPANVLTDGSAEVLDAFPDETARYFKAIEPDAESAALTQRFYYSGKATKADRNAGCEHMPRKAAGGMSGRRDGSMGSITLSHNTHPTVKPTALMQYLCRLITPPGGRVLDPFMGSGSTGKACALDGYSFTGIDLTSEYLDIAQARIAAAINSTS